MIIISSNTCRDALACVPHRAQVLLAHEWALSVLHIFEKDYPNDKRPRNCLDLVLQWIVDPNSVSKQQLGDTANAAYAAVYTANAASYASYAAVYTANAASYAANAAVYTAYAANAANAAANVASYAAYAAYAAVYTANAAVYTANAASYAANATAYAASNAANAAANWQFIEDTFNNCYCPDLIFDDNWKTSTVVELAKTIFNNNALDYCPILADALEDAGCTETKVLDRLRNAAILRSEWIICNLLNICSTAK